MFILFSITTWFDTCLQVWNSLCDAEEDDDDDDINSDRPKRIWFSSIDELPCTANTSIQS